MVSAACALSEIKTTPSARFLALVVIRYAYVMRSLRLQQSLRCSIQDQDIVDGITDLCLSKKCMESRAACRIMPLWVFVVVDCGRVVVEHAAA
jgi:hypothetical protein